MDADPENLPAMFADPRAVIDERVDLLVEVVGDWEWLDKGGRLKRADAPPGAFDIFIRALAQGHTERNAAQIAVLPMRLVNRRRRQDAHFREQCENAEQMSLQVLEQEALRRGINGSDQMLMFMLRARAPHIYRERHTGTGDGGPSHDAQLSAAVRQAFALSPDVMAQAAKQMALAMRSEVIDVDDDRDG